jgi:hypothetical protein
VSSSVGNQLDVRDPCAKERDRTNENGTNETETVPAERFLNAVLFVIRYVCRFGASGVAST